MQWLTTHKPSSEHDLSTGLRENFNPKARWRSAIAGAVALNRLQSFGSKASKSSVDSSWDSDDDEVSSNKMEKVKEGEQEETGSNSDFVNIVTPGDSQASTDKASSVDSKPPTPSADPEIPPHPVVAHPPDVKAQEKGRDAFVENPNVALERPSSDRSIKDDSSERSYRMPGHFRSDSPHGHHHASTPTFVDLFKRLHLRFSSGKN